MKVSITKFRFAIDIIFSQVADVNNVNKEVVLAIDGKKLCIFKITNQCKENKEATRVDDFSFNSSKNFVASKASSRRVQS